MRLSKKMIFLSLFVGIFTLISSFLQVFGALPPCIPSFNHFFCSDFYNGELIITNLAGKIDDITVSAFPDKFPYVSIDKTSAKQLDSLTIKGIDTGKDIFLMRVDLTYRGVDTGIKYHDMTTINLDRKISLNKAYCEDSIITVEIKNEGILNVELSPIKYPYSAVSFFVNDVSDTDPNCDKTAIRPTETAICNRIEGISGINDLNIVGPSNRVKSFIYCEDLSSKGSDNSDNTCFSFDSPKCDLNNPLSYPCGYNPFEKGYAAIRDITEPFLDVCYKDCPSCETLYRENPEGLIEYYCLQPNKKGLYKPDEKYIDCADWYNTECRNGACHCTKDLTGDINSDKKVNIMDISIAAKAFGSRSSNSRWNPAADLDHNGLINIVDITKIAKNFGNDCNCRQGLLC